MIILLREARDELRKIIMIKSPPHIKGIPVNLHINAIKVMSQIFEIFSRS